MALRSFQHAQSAPQTVGQIRQRCSPADIRHQGGIFYPSELVVKDLKQKTETRLIVHNVNVGAELNGDLFDPDKLKQAEIPAITTQP